MSKKLGEIMVDDDSLFVNNSIESLFDDEDDAIFDHQRTVEIPEEDDEDSEVPVIEEVVDEDDDSTEDSDEEVSEGEETPAEDYSDYSGPAILALSLKQEDSDLIPIDINKDLSPTEFLNVVKESIATKIKTKEEELESQYEGIADYITYLRNGGSPQTAAIGLSYKEIATTELQGDEEEAVLEDLVRPYLLRKGTLEKDVDILIDSYKDKGVLFERAKESIEYHKQQEIALMEQANQQIADERKQKADADIAFRTKITNVIKQGTAKGLPIKDKKKLEDAIFKATENVEGVDNQGRKVIYKDTLMNVKYRELSQDMEQQVALFQLLLDGFDFTSIKQVAKQSVNNELINLLNKKTKQTNSYKNYFSN